MQLRNAVQFEPKWASLEGSAYDFVKKLVILLAGGVHCGESTEARFPFCALPFVDAFPFAVVDVLLHVEVDSLAGS